ncbi:hypothetical protein KAH94_05095 [bacterium]|nr:hypothetical protein [bacterium]
MKKTNFTILLTFLLLSSCATFAMQQEPKSSSIEIKVNGSLIEEIIENKNSIKISSICNNQIKTINNDFLFLNGYFKEMWNLFSRKNKNVKPSKFFTFLEKPETEFNNAINTKYMPATDYLKNFLKPRYKTFDQAYKKKLKETKSLQKTFAWLSPYFTNNGLKKPLREYQIKLIKIDQTVMHLKEVACNKKINLFCTLKKSGRILKTYSHSFI